RLTGIIGLYAEAFARLRDSARLRGSLAVWALIGLILSEVFAVLVAIAHGSAAVPFAVTATFGLWILVTLVVLGGAALLTTPAGIRLDRYGVPNGLTALRAYGCLPLLLVATL